jgi:hypothetical protein
LDYLKISKSQAGIATNATDISPAARDRQYVQKVFGEVGKDRCWRLRAGGHFYFIKFLEPSNNNFMKTSKSIFLVALMLVLFEGCKKDDPAPANGLVGTWKEVSIVTSNCTDPLDNDTYNCDTDCGILVFTATTLSADGDAPVAYTVSGNTFTSDGDVLTFVIAGANLTITYQEIPANGGCKLVMTYKRV